MIHVLNPSLHWLPYSCNAPLDSCVPFARCCLPFITVATVVSLQIIQSFLYFSAPSRRQHPAPSSLASATPSSAVFSRVQPGQIWITVGNYNEAGMGQLFLRGLFFFFLDNHHRRRRFPTDVPHVSSLSRSLKAIPYFIGDLVQRVDHWSIKELQPTRTMPPGDRKGEVRICFLLFYFGTSSAHHIVSALAISCCQLFMVSVGAWAREEYVGRRQQRCEESGTVIIFRRSWGCRDGVSSSSQSAVFHL